MKKTVISIIVVFFIIFTLATCLSKTYAIGLDKVQSNPDSYAQTTEDNSGAVAIGNVIVWLVRTVGEAIAVVMLLILGIKYILGSVEEKAEYKQSMWPYVLGAILIFAGAALTDIIYKAFN